MFTTRTTDSCRHCEAPAKECASRGMFPGAGRCCRRCRPWHRAHRERVERVEVPERPAPAAVASVAPTEVLDRHGEDELVAGILRRAEAEDVAGGAVELYDQPSTAAYRALAKSRGLDLAVVVRHAVRGELRAVVQMPITTDHKPDPAPAGPYSTNDEGDHDV